MAPAAFIDPCLPSVADKSPSAEGWIHEIKHDGFRLQIHIRDGRVGLYTMTGVDWTKRYPWIVQDAARLKVRHAILDTECCVDGEDGVTDFSRLMARGHDETAYAYAFDVLAIDEDDLRPLPLLDRKARLARVLRRAQPGVRFSEHLTGDGPTIFRHACAALGLEGIVSKRANAPYRSGRAKTWLKTKNRAAPAYLRIVDGTF